MASLTILRKYASKADPSSLPASVLFTHTASSLTIFDLYPKSNSFHFLLLPRIVPPLTETNTASLKALLRWDKAGARACLEGLARDAEDVKRTIRQEMTKRFGFEWPIYVGFHAVPSMEHLHLHIIASDLFSERLKHKKHYNSFHPKLGFFLHLDEVLAWFEATPSFYDTMSKLSKSQYEPLLKEDLVCWRCDEAFKAIPKLKEHLRQEWDNDAAKAKARKRKREAKDDSNDATTSKRPAVGVD
ncbi:hypothetical protein JB92DRAFT_3037504 [Gautieria morchelliformis]|nr:hypothetical protein JB92DRAFT_3037504 [Gautieria morchelliformis]